MHRYPVCTGLASFPEFLPPPAASHTGRSASLRAATPDFGRYRNLLWGHRCYPTPDPVDRPRIHEIRKHQTLPTPCRFSRMNPLPLDPAAAAIGRGCSTAVRDSDMQPPGRYPSTGTGIRPLTKDTPIWSR